MVPQPFIQFQEKSLKKKRQERLIVLEAKYRSIIQTLEAAQRLLTKRCWTQLPSQVLYPFSAKLCPPPFFIKWNHLTRWPEERSGFQTPFILRWRRIINVKWSSFQSCQPLPQRPRAQTKLILNSGIYKCILDVLLSFISTAKRNVYLYPRWEVFSDVRFLSWYWQKETKDDWQKCVLEHHKTILTLRKRPRSVLYRKQWHLFLDHIPLFLSLVLFGQRGIVIEMFHASLSTLSCSMSRALRLNL